MDGFAGEVYEIEFVELRIGFHGLFRRDVTELDEDVLDFGSSNIRHGSGFNKLIWADQLVSYKKFGEVAACLGHGGEAPVEEANGPLGARIEACYQYAKRRRRGKHPCDAKGGQLMIGASFQRSGVCPRLVYLNNRRSAAASRW